MNRDQPNEDAIELEHPWQLFYLPAYTRRFRLIESKVVRILERLSFQECLFPKLISHKQFEELQQCMPRFGREWTAETLAARVGRSDVDYERNFHLCHWQCEPFYYFLRSQAPQHSIRFYDRSGWSFRAEAYLAQNRLLAFQRIEAVFYVPEFEAQPTLDRLTLSLQKLIEGLGMKVRLVMKRKEMASTGEILVRDLEMTDAKGKWWEVVGSHLHGRLLLDGLGVAARPDYVTGCCGIAMSRIANLAAPAQRVRRRS